MKTKKSLIMLLLALVLSVSITAVACSTPRPNEGPETGVYYCDTANGEYLLTLGGGDVFALSTDKGNFTGRYKLEETKITLEYSDATLGMLEGTFDASAEQISLFYSGEYLVFLLRKSVTVTFDSQGGSPVDAVKVVKGKSFTAPNDPVKNNYEFAGWFKDDDTPFIFGLEKVTADMTLHARWDEKVLIDENAREYNVDFVIGYDGGDNPQSCKTVGGKVTLPDVNRDDYVFDGWYLSHTDNANELTMRVTEDTVISEDVTLFGQWSERGKVSIKVSANEDRIVWNNIEGGGSYTVAITDESGSEKSYSAQNASYDPKWSALPAGKYEIKVTKGNYTSEPRYFINKRLTRVSQFNVNDNRMLRFGGVKNAEHYYITVKCGNPYHNHTEFDNGPSTVFNLGNCVMPEDGIKIVVKATSEGRIASTSREFVFKRTLAQISQDDYVVDDKNETISWKDVDGATGYMVSVVCENEKHNHTVEANNVFDNGDSTSYCYKECAGTVKIAVYAKAKGYYSPASVTKEIIKTTMPTPVGVKLNENILSWNAVKEGAKYVVRVNDTDSSTITDTSYDISDLVKDLADNAECVITVKTIGEGELYDSLRSDEISAIKNNLGDSIKYKDGTITWSHVLGAAKYEIKVNGVSQSVVDDGSNCASVELTQEGNNIIEISCQDKFGQAIGTAVSTTVVAHSITFDSQGGSSVEKIYVAVGDRINLPKPTMDRHEFCGWYNVPGGADCNGAEYTDTIFNESGSIILFAYWKAEGVKVKFVYSTDSVTTTPVGDYVETAEVRYGEKDFKFPEVKPFFDDEVFVSWCFKKDDLSTELTNEYGEALGTWTLGHEYEDEDGYIKLYPYTVKALVFTEIDSPIDNDGAYSVRQDPAGIQFLSQITIPVTHAGKPVRQIGSFEDCRGLTLLRIPDTINYIFDGAFTNDIHLNIEVYETDPDLGLSIGPYGSLNGMLYSTKETQDGSGVTTEEVTLVYIPSEISGKVVIPASVTSIGLNLFNGKDITEVFIPSSVTTIEGGAFADCVSLRTVEFGDRNTDVKLYSGVFSNCTSLEQLKLPGKFILDSSATIGDLVTGCNNLEAITIGSGNANYASYYGMVYSVDSRTQQLTNLVFCPRAKSREFIFSPSLSAIEDGAFADCTGITSMTLPNSLVTIGNNAFARSSITDITIGNSTKTIGDYAFTSCKSLRSVSFTDRCQLASIGERAFSRGTWNNNGWNFNSEEENGVLVGMVIPSTVASIDDYAFFMCTKAINVLNLPNAERIGEKAFYGVESLTWVDYGTAEPTISSEAFTNTQYNNLGAMDGFICDSNGFMFRRVNGSVELVGYSGTESQITLPRELPAELRTDDDDNSYSIGNAAFRRNYIIHSLLIPGNVARIDDFAFAGALNLTDITIEEGVQSIGKFAFSKYLDEERSKSEEYGNKVQTLTIPSSITSIETGAFEGDCYLRHVNFTSTADKGLTNIGNSAFRDCTSLSMLRLPDTLNGIESYAFSGCTGLCSVVVGQGVQEINNYAFKDCTSLVEVRFINTSLTKVEPGDQTSFGSIAANAQFVDYGDVESRIVDNDGFMFLKPQGDEEFATFIVYSGRDEDVVFPDYFSENTPYVIRERACYKSFFGNSVTFGQGLLSVGKEAFLEANTLEKVVFPSNSLCSSVEEGAFKQCTSLEEVQLSDNIITIGKEAFRTLLKLSRIRLGTELVTIQDNAFSECTSLGQLYIPDKVESIGKEAFYKCINLSSVTLGQSLASIEDKAFAACAKLTNIVNNSALIIVPGSETNGSVGKYLKTDDSITTVTKDGYVFKEYPSGEVELKDYVGVSGILRLPYDYNGRKYKIADGAFANRTEIISVIIPGNVTDIGKNAFKGQNGSRMNIRSVFIGDGVQSIGASAFEYCTLLSEIDVPASVKVINGKAFYYNEGLAKVTLRGVETIGAEAFASCKSLVEFNVAATLKVIGSKVFVEHPADMVIRYAGSSAQWYKVGGSDAINDPGQMGGYEPGKPIPTPPPITVKYNQHF